MNVKAKALVVLFFILFGAPLPAATVKRLDGDPANVIIVRPAEATVTIDVKDAEATVILKSMQKQCGLKNLMIDPQVKTKGTFYLYNVPCRQAWAVVLRSLGLDGVTYANSIVTIGNRKK